MQRQFRETNAQNKTEIKIGGEKLLVTTLPFPYGILDSMIDDSLLFFFFRFTILFDPVLFFFLLFHFFWSTTVKKYLRFHGIFKKHWIFKVQTTVFLDMVFSPFNLILISKCHLTRFFTFTISETEKKLLHVYNILMSLWFHVVLTKFSKN